MLEEDGECAYRTPVEDLIKGLCSLVQILTVDSVLISLVTCEPIAMKRALRTEMQSCLTPPSDFKPNGVFTPEQDNDKTMTRQMLNRSGNDTGLATTGVKGIIGMHRFKICLVLVLSLSCRCLALL